MTTKRIIICNVCSADEELKEEQSICPGWGLIQYWVETNSGLSPPEYLHICSACREQGTPLTLN